MERLDKVIASQTSYSRSDVKDLIRKKKIFVNDILIKDSGFKVDTSKDIIKVDEDIIEFKKYVYLVLNKPKGYVSATEDRDFPTVLELVDDKYRNRDLFPAGRLDKDTTGLMIITDDGVFAHDILSPKKHVSKEYEVTIDIDVTENMVKGFRDGVQLNDGICKSSRMEIIDHNKALVELTEGRYHQIKRMFGCYGAKVIELNRIRMGKFILPSDLDIGESRELTNEELDLIKSRS